MFRTVKNDIERADRYWSLREDLHARFDSSVEPHLVDDVLDSVAAESERAGGIPDFRVIFVEREAVSQLRNLAEGDSAHNYTLDLAYERAA